MAAHLRHGVGPHHPTPFTTRDTVIADTPASWAEWPSWLAGGAGQHVASKAGSFKSGAEFASPSAPVASARDNTIV